MVYRREDFMAIWRSRYTVSDYPEDSPIPNLKSSDYKAGTTFCIHCKSWVDTLVKVNDRWACATCNKVVIGLGRGKTASIYRITNDLLDYFGPEVPADYLLNGEIVNGFVKFAGLENPVRKGDFLLFLSLLRVILSKEIGQLSILDYLSKAERKLNKTPTILPLETEAP